MNSRTRRSLGSALAVAALTTPVLFAGAAGAAANGHGPEPARKAAQLAAKLVEQSSGKDAWTTLERLQSIADRNGGTRVAGSAGHAESADYVAAKAREAGLKVSRQEFDYVFNETLAERLAVVSPQAEQLAVLAMTYSASGPDGGLVAPLAVVPVDATSGCEPTDYQAGAVTGRIALIQRGGCSFGVKQTVAAAAGAAGVLIYNNVDGPLAGTLGDPAVAKVPTGGLSRADGEALAAKAAAGPVTLNLDIRTFVETRKTWNVLAETQGGDENNTVMVGAHLDSVLAGPGINDNGSGSAGILEVARSLADRQVKNKVRFAWWSAEEFGLVGSKAYVAALPAAEQQKIKLYLNFDMIASPNSVQFVYDGDNSDQVGSGPGPEGSAQIERLLNGYLDGNRKPHEGADFTGRSDYGPFIAAGIPAGGTATGAEGIKSEAQAAKYGGTAGVAFDKCYHQACDTLANFDHRAFDLNIDVIANAVGTYAWDLSSLAVPVAPEQTTGGSADGGLHEDHVVAE
ncbi:MULTISPECIES: M28 family metallopeptidase [unclassified Kitasatospora]|uniref:M28 family metallopeptidase n=1 Tax=unclassified Kitasatospora TaxID=2633591 RepID=UPI000709AAF1|nr:MULTISPECIES: M28 family metallopeptidase [unclassified Kitasatospora]KQV24019.1 amidohydrolase [Kitasatospora sp. Root107]KRB67267.1 amidohydrolase [Kitasatospora sp. Root187]